MKSADASFSLDSGLSGQADFHCCFKFEFQHAVTLGYVYMLILDTRVVFWFAGSWLFTRTCSSGWTLCVTRLRHHRLEKLNMQ